MVRANSGAASAQTLERCRLTSPAMAVDCEWNEEGQIRVKREAIGDRVRTWSYEYDPKGHLLHAFLDGQVAESYAYSPDGKRIHQQRNLGTGGDANAGRVEYDERGRLISAGNFFFTYTDSGTLHSKGSGREVQRFTYGQDTLLDTVVLATGETLRYAYSRATPRRLIKRFRNGELSAEYEWSGRKLVRFQDHERQHDVRFSYGKGGELRSLTISPHGQYRRGPQSVNGAWPRRDG